MRTRPSRWRPWMKQTSQHSSRASRPAAARPIGQAIQEWGALAGAPPPNLGLEARWDQVRSPSRSRILFDMIFSENRFTLFRIML
jgi:hypothetical protein